MLAIYSRHLFLVQFFWPIPSYIRPFIHSSIHSSIHSLVHDMIWYDMIWYDTVIWAILTWQFLEGNNCVIHRATFWWLQGHVLRQAQYIFFLISYLCKESSLKTIFFIEQIINMAKRFPIKKCRKFKLGNWENWEIGKLGNRELR